MKISIKDDVLNNEKWFPILDILLMQVEEDRHTFDDQNLPELLSSKWIAKRPRGVRELIGGAATYASYDADAHKSSIIIDSASARGGIWLEEKSETLLHPLDAIFFLSTPFQVVVENEHYDGAFLLWMSRAAGFPKLLNAYRAGKFVFRHAGGKDSISRSAEIFSHGVWPRENKKYSRAFKNWLCALLDNDATHPGHEPNKKIIDESLKHCCYVHELRKRSIESYIPQGYLKKYAAESALSKKVTALFRLSREQRQHYHMKKGFKISGNPASKQTYLEQSNINIKTLYSDVSEKDWPLLNDGFGGGLSKVFVEEYYRCNPNDPLLTDLDDRQEILEISRSIYQRI